ncbi:MULTISPECIES: hypothetical protein [Sphingomonas]|uniref:DUF3899 domain-containing protein n=1 Tax=Sphingomonas molluscorum TaxID=418184 RepID=A0ABU8Q7K6_9SPHN|nr:hypothetical protein [Sphingomonas sp. JUb134]MBM7407075.1 putative P-loop ATPase [Sphingomonas sp. JUb134]
MDRESLAVALLLGGFVWVGACVVMSIRGATYETRRPWADFQQRARKKRDGTPYVQTYWSKGPGVTKATLDKRFTRLSLIGTAAMIVAMLL